jgi:hypothetical protein
MRRILLWLSGVDRNLLAKCTRLPQSEALRFEGYGGLVLIPPAVGFIAAAYAVSTFVPNLAAAIAGGVVWAAIIGWIERFLAMTMYKSTLRSVFYFWAGFVIRLLMAGVVGYGLSHPVMLLLFHGPIEQEMFDEGRARERAAFEDGNKIKAQAYQSLNQARTDAMGELPAELDRKTKLWECKSTLVSMEQAKGVVPGTLARDRDGNVCGVASGEEGCKARCQVYLKERDQLAGEIADIKQQMKERRDRVEDGGMTQDIAQATQYANRENQQIASEKPPTDYAARTRALAAVETKHPEIKAVHTFLVFFLILLDTLVVSLKAITPENEYEEVRDTALAEARAIGQAQRASTTAWAASSNTLTQDRLKHEHQKNEMAALFQVVNDVLHEQTLQLQQFEAKFAALDNNVGKVRNDEDRQVFRARSSEIRRAYSDAWGKATERFRAYIRGL